MDRYLEVASDGLVVNIAVWDGQSSYAPDGITLLPCSAHPGVAVGWRQVDGGWLPPDGPVPQSVTMRQARLALLSAGLLTQVDQLIDGIPDLGQREAAKIEWEYAQDVSRTSMLVMQLAPLLGLNDEALDDLFRNAGSL